MRIASCTLSIVVSLCLNLAWAGQPDTSRYYPRTPDAVKTPGHLCTPKDKDFVQYRYKEKIPYCTRNVTPTQKSRIYAAYNIPANKRHNYTIDHYIPLSLGGSNAPENLWPEHRKIKQLRRDLELELFYRLERGEMTQREAIEIITEAKMNPPAALFEFADFL